MNILKKMNLSVSSIWATCGEIYFRKIEHESFVELLSSQESMIISLGGGTPCYANNHELLKQEGVISIYLKASIDTLFKIVLQ
jgi:shikimate kinase